MRVYGFLLWVCLVGFGISLKPLMMPRDAFRRRLGTTSYSLQVCKEKQGEKSFQSFHPSAWFIIIDINEQGEPSVCVLGEGEAASPSGQDKLLFANLMPLRRTLLHLLQQDSRNPIGSANPLVWHQAKLQPF